MAHTGSIAAVVAYAWWGEKQERQCQGFGGKDPQVVRINPDPSTMLRLISKG